jgi:cell division protein ZapB
MPRQALKQRHPGTDYRLVPACEMDPKGARTGPGVLMPNNIQNSLYPVDVSGYLKHSVPMDAELKSLERKLSQFVEICQRLRADNQQLRQQLESAMSNNKQLSEKIGAATDRLETLLSQIPEEEA